MSSSPLHQAAQKAVEALKEIAEARYEHDYFDVHRLVNAARTALESALQQQPEPVAEPSWWGASLNRRATVEGWMFDAARGKRPMPTPEELRAWAIKLGTPAEGEPALQHHEVPSSSQWFADSPGIANHDWRGGWDACRNRCRELLEIAASGIARKKETEGDLWLAKLMDFMRDNGKSHDEIGAVLIAAGVVVAAAPSTPENAGGVTDGVMESSK